MDLLNSLANKKVSSLEKQMRTITDPVLRKQLCLSIVEILSTMNPNYANGTLKYK